jgi:Ca2+-dependent lipid-binding protein
VRKDTFGKSDPYVKVQLVNTIHSKKTTHKLSTLNPVWNEVVKLTIQDPKTQSLELQVFDWDKVGSHEKMGMVIVPLNELVENVPKLYNSLKLLKSVDPNDEKNLKSRGEITFEILFKPFKDDDDSDDQGEAAADGSQMTPEGTGGGLLTVTIVQAEGLEGKHHNNPFVELHFKGDKRKTHVVKKNREPRWDAEFTWNLEEAPENEHLLLEVHSRGSSMNMVHRQESLGHADISLRDLRGMSKRINETYTLVDGHGKIQVVLDWQAV